VPLVPTSRRAFRLPRALRHSVLPLLAAALVAAGQPAAVARPDTPSAAGTAVAAVPTPAARPYVRLFNHVVASREPWIHNTDTDVSRLAQWYVHLHSEAPNFVPFGTPSKRSSTDTTFAAKLVSRGVHASNYRNGSYVSQGQVTGSNGQEAADLEASAPLTIGTFWPGDFQPDTGATSSTSSRLTAPLSSTATTVRIRVVASRPARTPATWPWIRSTNSAAYSQSTADYVSWLRIDDEMLRISGTPTVSAGVVTVPVQRGYFGTARAAHAAETRVVAPTYVGASTAAGHDVELSGTPLVNDPNRPLRYAIKLWKPAAYHWLADRIRATFGPGLGGLNTVWLDVSTCKQYNNAAADGAPVANWYDDRATKMTDELWGSVQARKVAGLRTELPGTRFAGNNFAGKTDSCNRALIARTYDGSAFEKWLQNGPLNDFENQATQAFDVMANNLPAIFWARWDRPLNSSVEAYKRYTYGTLLLTLDPRATRYEYGGPWGLGDTTLAKPDQLYFWGMGAPTRATRSLADVAVGTTGLYRRDFANGFVLVNPGNSPVTQSVGTGLYDVSSALNGSPRPVSGSVTVRPRDAVLLMYSA
jgi:hypothetical protein